MAVDIIHRPIGQLLIGRVGVGLQLQPVPQQGEQQLEIRPADRRVSVPPMPQQMTESHRYLVQLFHGQERAARMPADKGAGIIPRLGRLGYQQVHQMAVLPIRMRVSVQNMRENHGQLPRPQDGRIVPHRHADSPPLHIQDFQGLVKMEGISHIAGRKHPDIRLLVLIPGMHDPPRLPCATNVQIPCAFVLYFITSPAIMQVKTILVRNFGGKAYR